MAWRWILGVAACCLTTHASAADALRLVPYPKQVHQEPGRFALPPAIVLELPQAAPAELLAPLREELAAAGCRRIEVVAVGKAPAITLAARDRKPPAPPALRSEADDEDYSLRVAADGVAIRAKTTAGLGYGVATLGQLLRANRAPDETLPCLSIVDWPSLRWRAFQDDLTRGPSAKLATLTDAVALGAWFKLNLFTYYMEYQFAFAKHPQIGPPDGSLTPDELRSVVAFGRARGVDVLGNQQSFGHFERILRHEQYAALREVPNVLSPVHEGTYRLLDDLYSEVCPLVPFPWFNVCCDETWGLGTGPSKELAEKIGTGGVYARHLRRVHDLLAEKHGKRMMMWGDIILQHPDHLQEIPRDTIMLTWDYSARDSFEKHIAPFARSGYQFFVCPGVSNWNRILPDFDVAATNIRNFVRDGVAQGALGMLNTEWKDDGECLRGASWVGFAWGAECAWNGGTTDPDAFYQRLGPVLFGPAGERFNSALARLRQTHTLPGMDRMMNARFWRNDFVPQRRNQTIEAECKALLELVEPALADLEACRREARINQSLLDAFLFNARRMQFIAARQRDGVAAVAAYAKACGQPRAEAAQPLSEAIALVRRTRDGYRTLGDEFGRLWLAESKPYALDWTMDRYGEATARLNALLVRLEQAAAGNQPLPLPESLGLEPRMAGCRRVPATWVDRPLDASAGWHAAAPRRFAVVVRANGLPRVDLPVEIRLPRDLASAARARAFRLGSDGAAIETPAQIDRLAESGNGQLTLIVPGRLEKNQSATLLIYLDPSDAATKLPGGVSTRDAADGAKWIENEKIRLLLGPEGSHVYRWEIVEPNVRPAEWRDLTMPGEKNWFGFADLGGAHRSALNRLTCTAAGPALVRYECEEPTGMVKTLSVYAGARWMEVQLDEPASYYWDFDRPDNFAADGPTPGRYLFSSGDGGLVGRQADGTAAQRKAQAEWAVKYNDQGLALGLLTPERKHPMAIAPGSGAGGVGVSGAPGVTHAITFGGRLDRPAREVMEQLRQTLTLAQPVGVQCHSVEIRPAR